MQIFRHGGVTTVETYPTDPYRNYLLPQNFNIISNVRTSNKGYDSFQTCQVFYSAPHYQHRISPFSRISGLYPIFNIFRLADFEQMLQYSNKKVIFCVFDVNFNV